MCYEIPHALVSRLDKEVANALRQLKSQSVVYLLTKKNTSYYVTLQLQNTFIHIILSFRSLFYHTGDRPTNISSQELDTC